MGRELLAIDEAKIPGLKLRDEFHKRYLGCVIDSRKHRFGKEGSTKRYAIESSDQAIILPCFYRMGAAEFVQAGIGVQHVIGDPGASLGILRARACALCHDLSETRVEGEGKHV